MKDDDAQHLGEILDREANERWGRFLDSLGEKGSIARDEAERAKNMRHELMVHLERMLAGPGDWKSLEHALWVREHVYEVTSRWVVVHREFERWFRTDPGAPFRVTVVGA